MTQAPLHERFAKAEAAFGAEVLIPGDGPTGWATVKVADCKATAAEIVRLRAALQSIAVLKRSEGDELCDAVKAAKEALR